MALVGDVIDRLDARVAALRGRVSGAAELADMMRRNALPQVTPAAHVLPAGIQAGRDQAATGLYIQSVDRAIAVVVTVRSHDASGARALGELDTLIDEVITALAGWGPDGAMGVFRLMRVPPPDIAAGTLVQEISFVLPDQLRITP